MPKLSKEELDELVNKFSYSNLAERYKVMEELFDIKEGDVVIDGGAFQGDMAQYFSLKVGKTGHVYSFEPLAANLPILEQCVKSQPLRNITIVPVALWDINEKVEMFLSTYTNAGSLLKNFRKVTEVSTIVRAATLDYIVDKYKILKVDYLWANIEGAEVNFLKGAKDTLIKNNCKLCISTHRVDDTYKTTDDCIKILESYGYKCRQALDKKGWLFAEKNV